MSIGDLVLATLHVTGALCGGVCLGARHDRRRLRPRAVPGLLPGCVQLHDHIHNTKHVTSSVLHRSALHVSKHRVYILRARLCHAMSPLANCNLCSVHL